MVQQTKRRTKEWKLAIIIMLLHLPTVHMRVEMYTCIHRHIHNTIYLLRISASKLLRLYKVFTISAFSCLGNQVFGYTEAHLGHVVSLPFW